MGKAGKRKFVDPVVAAAMDALSSSDDEVPIANLKKKKKTTAVAARDALLSSSDDDAPRSPQTKKKKPRASNISSKEELDGEGSDRNIRRAQLKPLFSVGDAVCAAWWPNKKSRLKNSNCSWHPGRVKACREKNINSPYGSERCYDILYDDGNELRGVHDHFVFSKLDYELTDLSWIGVRNVTDSNVNDKWAQLVGWYVAIIDGKEKPYSLLSDAMDAYDSWVVNGKKKKNIKRSDLNRPDQYSIFLFESSDSDGEPDGDVVESMPKRKSCGKDRLDQSESPRKHQNITLPAYKGVSYNKQDRKYLAQFTDIDGAVHRLGYYKFEADAALAVDKGSTLRSCEQTNFSNRKEYENSIQMEMETAGHTARVTESYDRVVGKVEVYLSKIYAAKNRVESRLVNTKKDNVCDDDNSMSETSDDQSTGKSRQTVNDIKTPQSPRKNGLLLYSYAGVGCTKATKKFRSHINYRLNSKNKCQWLGTYQLEADAALARDEALRLLKWPGKKNFATLQDYENAKLHETERTRCGADDAMSSAEIVSKVTKIISKIDPNLVKIEGPNHGNHESKRKPTTEPKPKSKTVEGSAPNKNGKNNEEPGYNLNMGVSSDSPTPTTSEKKKKYSGYVGISYHKRAKTWTALIRHDKKSSYLGSFKLEVDAAHAYDEALKLLNIPKKTNFTMIRDYEKAKLHELERTGFGMDCAMSSVDITLKVTKIISKTHPNIADSQLLKRNSESAESNTTKGPNDEDISEKAPVAEPKEQCKSSEFVGVTYNKRRSGYLSHIRYDRKQYYLGYYKLEADAAIAYDEAAKLLRGADSKVNFSAGRKDYTDARTKELEKSDFGSSDVETLVEIVAKIQRCLSKIPCPEITSINDAMAEKWARHLPTESGKEYLDLYRKSIDGILKSGKSQRDPAPLPSVVSDKHNDIRPPDVEREPAQGENPDALLKPIAEGNTDDSSNKSRGRNTPESTSSQQCIHSEPENDSDDDVSLFSSDTEEMVAKESERRKSDALPDRNSTPILRAPDDDSNQNITSLPDPANKHAEGARKQQGRSKERSGEPEKPNALPNNRNQNITRLPDPGDEHVEGTRCEQERRSKERSGGKPSPIFPIKCPVMWDLDHVSFSSGLVISAPIHGTTNGTAYEVMPAKHARSTMILEKSLAYGLNCPVYVSHGSESNRFQGKILFCRTFSSSATTEVESFLYTILIDVKEGNQFQVMHDVPSERVRYRDTPLSRSKNKSSADMRDVHGDMLQVKKPSAQENGSQMSSKKITSSNSTITSAESLNASSRRTVVDGSSGPKGESIVECRVRLPPWLVPDSVSKQRLISMLHHVDTRVGEVHQCIQRIGKRTNCNLRIVESDGFHILIQTRPGKYANENIRKAEEKLGHALLDHICHDGSSGRLFYDLARSCAFLHPRGSAHSTSVMQRNPFSSNNEMGWINIVELPYTRESDNRKHYHGHYLLKKKLGVLGHIKHETRCQIKICGDIFNVKTKYCPPYIFIIGDQPGMVDRAVEIIEEAISQHMSECRCIR